MESWQCRAEHFLTAETPFHLGMLPTEQAHGKTRGLAETLQHDLEAGLRQLMAVDDDVSAMARRVFAGSAWKELADALRRTMQNGGRICFSGCGATGRLCILIEAAWRRFWSEAETWNPANNQVARLFSDRVLSLMTGGDYALIRTVEHFEDHASFGRQQVRELGLGAGDMLVAISEGGETSSVIGTLQEAHERGAATCFAFNNPTRILAEHIERSRRVIENDAVIKLDLTTGPMAVAGSTRMQATTAELLVVGAVLEMTLAETVAEISPKTGARNMASSLSTASWPDRFSDLLADLSQPEAIRAMADWVELEQQIYAAQGRITYFAGDALLDIFTDTTERTPTFMLPPFRASGDHASPPSWAFVKDPLHATPAAWRHMLGREPRCLAWDRARYKELGAPPGICAAPPRLDRDELLKFLIGREEDASRTDVPEHAAIAVRIVTGPGTDQEWIGAFENVSGPYRRGIAVSIGERDTESPSAERHVHIPCRMPATRLRLWEHLAVKLIFNTVSTATMGRMGRLVGNWMAHVDTSNKKLLDRGTRIIAELAGVDYATACYALHETIAMREEQRSSRRERSSPVFRTIERLRDGRRNTTSNPRTGPDIQD